DPAGKNVFLALFRYCEVPCLHCRGRDRVHHVAQSDARMHLSLKTYEYAFGHVEGNHTERTRKRHQARPSGEGNPERKASMAVSTCADFIREQHTIEPTVDDAISRPE